MHLFWTAWVLLDITQVQWFNGIYLRYSWSFCSSHSLCKALFIETVKLMSTWVRKNNCTQEEIGMYLSCAQCKCTMQTTVCVFVLHATHRQRQFLCTVLYNRSLPSQPHCSVLGPWRRDYPLPCLSEAVGGGCLSMGPPSLPCLGLPLLPARPFSSAWHSGESCTEPEANLSLPHSPSKMISLSVLSTLSPRVLMRRNGCQ